MGNIKQQIPNMLTLANLLCGALAVTFVFQGQTKLGVYLVLAGLFFDFFDGFVARLLKVSSPLGAQLDSLADLISFGLFPSVLVNDYLYSKTCEGNCSGLIPESIYLYLGFAILVGSAYRLAKFNIDTEQTYHFKGVPTPINCLLFCALPFVLDYPEISEWPYFSKVLLIVVYLQSMLLVTNRPFLALKFKNYTVSDNWNKYLLLAVGIVGFIVFGFVSVIVTYGIYVLLSLTTIKQTE